jgi:hypothetical protein
MTPQNPSAQQAPNLAVSNRIALLLSQRLSAAQSLGAPKPSTSETPVPVSAPFSSLGARAPNTNGNNKTGKGNANPPPTTTTSKTQRYEDEDDLRSAGDPNAGIGMDPGAPKTGDAAKKEEALALRRKLLGKRRREDDGPARGRARAEESSDEEMGRSALGKKKARHAVTAYSAPTGRRNTDTRGARGTTNGAEPTQYEPPAVATPAEKITETSESNEDQEMGGVDVPALEATDGAAAPEANGAKKKRKRNKKKKKKKAETPAAETPS